MNSRRPESTSETSAREAILARLEEAMDDLYREIEATDPATTDEEKLQLRRYHEVGYLANQFRKLKRDTDLDEMDERLELLEDDSLSRES